MGSRLFKRQARITAYRANPGTPGGFINGNPSFFDTLPNATIITDLRVQVHIEKSIDKAPNTLRVIVTNLNESSRSDLIERPLTVMIDAGYDGVLRHIFTGDLRTGWSELKDADWLTHLHLADGDRAYRFARVNRSYKRGTPVVVAVQDCAKSMGLTIDARTLASSELQTTFVSGRVLDGPTRDELERLLAPYGYSFSFQNGQLQILRDEQTRQDQAYEIDEAHGMLGSPEFAVPDQPKKVPKRASSIKVPKIKVKNLLYPELQPGGKIKVSSRSVDGMFKIMRLTHDFGTGDGDDWFTNVEAVAV